jgi:anti-anti-sigma factor
MPPADKRPADKPASEDPNPFREAELRLLAAIQGISPTAESVSSLDADLEEDDLEDDDPEAPQPDPLELREKEIMRRMKSDLVADPLEIRVTHQEGVPVIRLQGELDLFTAEPFRRALREQAEAHPAGVIVDLSGVAYIDSTGLGILIHAARELTGALAVVSPRERVTRLFQAVGAQENLRLYPTMPEALWSFRKA